MTVQTTRLIRWRPEYSVGVPSIDEQHARLVRLYNDLSEALMEGEGSSIVRQTLGGLIDYTREHFAYEETLMARCEYPGLEGHRKLHAALVSRVELYDDALRGGRTDVHDQVLDFLKDWLVNHISRVDKGFGPRMRAAGID